MSDMLYGAVLGAILAATLVTAAVGIGRLIAQHQTECPKSAHYFSASLSQTNWR